MSQREREALVEYKQAASVEAGLRREFLARAERAEASIEEWIAYADKLEAALQLACGQTSDGLMRMHAEQGLRIVRPTDTGSVTCAN